MKIDNVKKEIADQKRQCVEKLRKEIGEKEKEVIEDVKKQADEKEKNGIENARLSEIEMRKTEIGKMKKEVDEKKTRKKIPTASEVKKEGDQAQVTTQRMVYDFDEEGFPIWEERPIPPESIGPTPPGWDTNLWVTHLTKTYQEISRSGYNKLYKSVERKKKRQRDLEEAERKAQEKQKEEEERNRQNETEKEF